jgi:hypothetical protein
MSKSVHNHQPFVVFRADPALRTVVLGVERFDTTRPPRPRGLADR